MHYRSSVILMARQFLLAAIAAAAFAGLACAGIEHLELPVPLFIPFLLAFLVCVVTLIIGGFVRVEVTDDAFSIFKPLRDPLVFPRDRFQFTSRVVAHSVNLIPVNTERILVALNDDEVHEEDLRNISKRSFDELMTVLRKTALEETAPEGGTVTASFDVPREAMLRDFRKMATIILTGLGLVALGSVVFLGYWLPASTGMPVLPMLLKTSLFGIFLFGGIGGPVVYTYLKRKRAMPERIALDGDALTIDADRFPMADIRRIVATPPAYGESEFANRRSLLIQTDWDKKKYDLGIRIPRGIWKTAFDGYPDLCHALEEASRAHHFDMVYDL